ncbi:MAG: methylamine methyltransferase corrinoid protein reductive activase [Desulfobacterales bacterium]
MPKIGIALDLGTSGFRGQAIDLDNKGIILSTSVTTRHPLPGANVMDHLHFALDVGLNWAHDVMVQAINRVIDNLWIKRDQVVRVAVCGNPIQLSLFQEIEFRDLAYAGKRKLKALGVVPPKRDAQIVKAPEIRGLDLPEETDVLIPPAIRHEIGADALAMMIQSGMLEKEEIAITTDYGTNAEMALLVDGVVYTGSTAAGPALEGQQIEDGLLALPGAISDVAFISENHINSELTLTAEIDQPLRGVLETFVLDNNMKALPGDTVDPITGKLITRGKIDAVGITGTGVVALLSEGLKSGLIRIPRIKTPDGKIYLPNRIKFSEKDFTEAGKAIGAVRAGHMSLCQEAGIRMEDIETAYMSGASGTYVDALKAQAIGMIPSGVKKIFQVGNTSLAMARDMVKDEDELWHMKQIADELRQTHCMFAESKVFEKIYILELSYWTEGLPLNQYRKFLKKFGLPPLMEVGVVPEVIKTVKKDIPDLGTMGLRIISDIGQRKTVGFQGCTGCRACIDDCPENALALREEGEDFQITLNLALCDGFACMRCERACSEKVFNLIKLITAPTDDCPTVQD